MMEVYAAAVAQSDHEIGRIIDALAESGQLDNTLVIYIEGDNGASAEGTLRGITNEVAQLNPEPESIPFLLSMMDQLGSDRTYNHYPVGWAHAMDTPFQWTKQVASHFGGTRNGMAMSWPARIKVKGEIRSQFHHVNDITPTILEAVGVQAPLNSTASSKSRWRASAWSTPSIMRKLRRDTRLNISRSPQTAASIRMGGWRAPRRFDCHGR